jgi:DNA-binding transcriptional LysR family regulator
MIRQTTNSLQNLITLLKKGEVDFVFAVCPKDIEAFEDISSELLMMDQMNLIFPTGSPFAGRKSLEFKEIVDMPIITAPEGTGLTDALHYQFTIHGAAPNIVIETSDIAIIPKYVANHLGLSAFPSFIMPDLIRAHDIVGVKLSNESFVVRLYLLWNNTRFQSSTVKTFLQMAKDYYLNRPID